MSNLIAWHNDPQLKRDTLAKMRAHRDADELLQGNGYWENGKGCAVGCLIQGGNHLEYELRFGIPKMLAWFEDLIFENLLRNTAQLWPELFLDSIEVGADLSCVGWLFLRDMMRDISIPKSDDFANILCREVIKSSAELMDLYARGFHDLRAVEAAKNLALQARFVTLENRVFTFATLVAWQVADFAAFRTKSSTDRIIHLFAKCAQSDDPATMERAYQRMSDTLIKHIVQAEKVAIS